MRVVRCHRIRRGRNQSRGGRAGGGGCSTFLRSPADRGYLKSADLGFSKEKLVDDIKVGDMVRIQGGKYEGYLVRVVGDGDPALVQIEEGQYMVVLRENLKPE